MPTFQFQIGTIGSQESYSGWLQSNSFNSRLVRLVAALPLVSPCFSFSFQFQIGTIGSDVLDDAFDKLTEFQFQIGTIGSRLDSITGKIEPVSIPDWYDW